MNVPVDNPGSPLDVLISTTQDAVVFIDQDARIVRFNAAAEAAFGYTAEEVIGQNVMLLMPDKYAKEHDGYIESYEQTGEAHAIGQIRRVSGRRKSGEVFPIELSVTEMPRGSVARYAAFIRDVSASVRMQEELIERERLAAIGTTVATFAHEIGNPLNSMFMNAQLAQRQLRNTEGADPKLVERCTRIVEQLKRLNALLQEFRALARRQRMEFSSVDLNTVVKEVVDNAMVECEASGISTRFMASANDAHAEVDGAKMTQVVVNLVKNGAEAMLSGGILTVRLHADEDQVSILVEDEGGGVPEDVDIFTPFISTKELGTGLGLAVVRRIVEAHHGEIRYRAREGGGTVFEVELPKRQLPGRS